jgi:hypothetical protein
MGTQTVAPSESKPENAAALVRSGKFLTFFQERNMESKS